MTHWQVTRITLRPIPDQIWDAVLPLVTELSYSTINKKLGLSYQQVKNKLAMRKADPSPQQNTFVSVDLASIFFNHDQGKHEYKITLTKPNGVSLVIDEVTLNFISEIIASFVSQSC